MLRCKIHMGNDILDKSRETWRHLDVARRRDFFQQMISERLRVFDWLEKEKKETVLRTINHLSLASASSGLRVEIRKIPKAEKVE